jgi:hypothetical protein
MPMLKLKLKSGRIEGTREEFALRKEMKSWDQTGQWPNVVL